MASENRTEHWISLFSSFLSPAQIMLSQKPALQKMADANTVIEGLQEWVFQPALPSIVKSCETSPVFVWMNTNALLALYSLTVHYLDAQCLSWRMFVPAEVYHQLLDFSRVDLEIVQLALVHKVPGQFSKLLIVPVSDEGENSRVIREHLKELENSAV